MLSTRSSLTVSKVFFALALAVTVAGCGASTHKKGLEDMRLTGELVDKVQKEGKVELAESEGVLCRLEMPTGSHLGVWRCDTYAGYESRSTKNQREMQKAQATPKGKVFD